MRALVYHGREDILPEDVQKPRAGSGELLLKPLYVGVCFTEKHVYDGEETGLRIPTGMTIGHEASAEVVEVGEGVERFQAGDRVALQPALHCGHCALCLAGLPCACDTRLRDKLGAWMGLDGLRSDSRQPFHGMAAEYCVAPARNCYQIPAEVSDAAGALVEPLSVAFRAARSVPIRVGDSVAILGADDYSLYLAATTSKMGCQVVVVDPIALRRKLATKMGANAVVDPLSEDAVKAVRRLMPLGPDSTFICMENYINASRGYPEYAFKMTKFMGTVLLIRYHGKVDPCAGIGRAFNRGVTVRQIGDYFGEQPERGGKQRGDFQLTIDSIARKQADPMASVTKVIDFKDVSSKQDVRGIFKSLPAEQFKILIRIWGR